MKLLISSCVMGNKVRWNGASKEFPFIKDWAEENGIKLTPVCPENELLGTPRPSIRLIQVGDEVHAHAGKNEISEQLRQTSKNILERHPDAVGFIGIANSPTCGVSAGVKKRGSTMKGIFHLAADFPTCEVNQLKSEQGRQSFLRRVAKWVEKHRA